MELRPLLTFILAVSCLNFAVAGTQDADDAEQQPSCSSDTAQAVGACAASDTSSGSCGCGAVRRSDFADATKPTVAPGTSREVAGELRKTAGESLEAAGIIFLEGGSFLMGAIPQDADPSSPFVDPRDNEQPRTSKVEPFGLGAYEVSNRRFSTFVQETRFVTESERFGWSFGVEAFISAEVNATIESQVAAAPWWLPVNHADWLHPNGFL